MSDSPRLPGWLVVGAVVLMGCLLLFHVVYDALNKSYSNQTLSLALLGAFCMAVGWKNQQGGGT